MLYLYRQGDVGIHSTSYLDKNLQKEYDPSNCREQPDGALAYGEVTGHAHRVDPRLAQVMVNKAITEAFEHATEKCLVVPKGKEAKVTHEEHEGIVFKGDNYRVTIQRAADYANKKIRRVVD